MNKQDFLFLKKNYDSKIEELDNLKKKIVMEKYDLCEKYVEEHRQFQNGDAVVIKTDGAAPVNVFVSSAHQSDGEIKYSFIKMKKDGTPGVHNHYIDSFDEQRNLKIELIHSDYRGKNADGTPIESYKE